MEKSAASPKREAGNGRRDQAGQAGLDDAEDKMAVSPRYSQQPISLRRGLPRATGAVAALDVVDDELLEIRRDGRAAQGHRLLAVDEHRRGRRLAGAGQRNADVGVLGFAGP